jgi:hypothetical protein
MANQRGLEEMVQPRSSSLDQSQESGVACSGFEPVARGGPAELGILDPLEHHHPLD